MTTGSVPHPGARELAAFTRGDLRASDWERVSRHLAACRSCERIVSDLRGEGSGGDEEIETAWAALRSRIDRPAPSQGRRVLAAAAALGAVLSVAAVWLAATTQARLEEALRRIAQLETSLAETRIPHAGVAAVDLLPRGTLRNDAEVPELRIEAGTRLALLRLLLTGSGEGEMHRLVARDEAGRPLWTVEEVRTDSLQRADVALPVQALAAGTLELALVRRDGREGDVAAEFTFRILRGEP